ncbi:hypothetical protein [Mesorhizobium sp. M0520]|uniref:hypothetical protein n=1 Tax=Mesorhizobium sp. M0520 TaxID=2956957 RepID=UPI003334CF42
MLMSKWRDRRLDIRRKELSNGFHGERPLGSGDFALLSSFKEQAFLLLRFIGRLLCLFAFLIILIQLMSYLFNAEWLPLSLMAFLLLIPDASRLGADETLAHIPAPIVLLIIGLAAWIVGSARSNRSH